MTIRKPKQTRRELGRIERAALIAALGMQPEPLDSPHGAGRWYAAYTSELRQWVVEECGAAVADAIPSAFDSPSHFGEEY